jgi:hypothetical protein
MNMIAARHGEKIGEFVGKKHELSGNSLQRGYSWPNPVQKAPRPRRRMISRPAGRCRGDAIEPQLAQFQRIDEHIDRPNRIALVHPIIADTLAGRAGHSLNIRVAKAAALLVGSPTAPSGLPIGYPPQPCRSRHRARTPTVI